MLRKLFAFVFIGFLYGCCSEDKHANEHIAYQIKDGIQNQASLKQLKAFFRNNNIQAVWSIKIAENEYLMVLEEEVYKVVYVDFRFSSKSYHQIKDVLQPYGECCLAINEVVTVTKDYFIISEKSNGSGYCADFPSVFSLKSKKKLTKQPLEILEFNFPELSEHFYLSEVNYLQNKHSIVAKIIEYKVNDESKDTIGIRKIEKILY